MSKSQDVILALIGCGVVYLTYQAITNEKSPLYVPENNGNIPATVNPPVDVLPDHSNTSAVVDPGAVMMFTTGGGWITLPDGRTVPL